MLYRMVENGTTPKVKIVATSKEHGEVPTWNTLAIELIKESFKIDFKFIPGVSIPMDLQHMSFVH